MEEMTAEDGKKSNLSKLKNTIQSRVEDLLRSKYRYHIAGSPPDPANLIFTIHYIDDSKCKLRGLLLPLCSDDEVFTLLKEKISNFQGRVRLFDTEALIYRRVLNEESLYATILQHVLRLPKTGIRPVTMGLYLDGAELAIKK